MFKLSVFTDEISQDFARAADVAKEYGLDGVEIRSVWDKPPQDIGKSDIDKMKSILDSAGLEVSCIASPFFKCNLDSEKEYKEHLDILRRCCALAHAFDCTIVRGFTFWQVGNQEEVWDKVLEKFQEPLNILDDEQITLGIENEHSTNISTGDQLARFLKALDSERVKGIWDPCNSVHDTDCGEKVFPDGYAAIKKQMVHFHVKDCAPNPETGNIELCPVGEGVVDYHAHFRALKEDGYSGYASLETHWRPKSLDEVAVMLPGGTAFSEEGETASRICLANINNILRTYDRKL